MTKHPELMKATVLAALVTAPDWTKRQLVSKDAARRERAEEVIAARITVALSQLG